jgi:DNA-binding GntR family transcriptional regulator
MPTRKTPAKSPVASLPTDAQIHDRIVNAVLDQRLPPGTRLAEDKLGQVFGVSRTRIRQVLIRLAGEQLVTLTPNRGARVAEPTAAEAQEVFAVRRLIEPALVAGFIGRAGRDELAGLKRWIDDEEAARRAGDAQAAIRTAGLFHLHIAAHAGNATLERLMRELTSRTALVLMSFGPADLGERDPGAGPGGSCACHEHRSLYAAIRLRDVAAANRLMLEHLARLEAQLEFDLVPTAEPDLAQMLLA